jgi:hypothetical protein
MRRVTKMRSGDSGLTALLTSNLPPQLPVKGAILNRFTDMVAGNVLRAGEVGDGAGNFQYPVVGPGAEVVLISGRCLLLPRPELDFRLHPLENAHIAKTAIKFPGPQRRI